MHPLAQRLHDDHRRLTQVLDVLEAQIDRVARAEDADLDLMLEAMTYITDFPNRLHHPVEDVLFKCLAAIDPASAGLCQEQIAEHERLFHDSAALNGLLEAIQLEEAMAPRDHLVHAGQEFVAAQRAHLLREEHDLLPRAQLRLGSAQWDIAAQTASAVSDPLDGTATPARYQSLYQTICTPHQGAPD